MSLRRSPRHSTPSDRSIGRAGLRRLRPGLWLAPLFLGGCTSFGPAVSGDDTCRDPAIVAEAEQARLFRQAETERATQLLREIERLKADLKTAEAALVEAESGLAGNHSRADAVSSLATTRIQIERAEARAPWRGEDIALARAKLEEAERQVAENRFGAALFFDYRARRVAESILAEARVVHGNGNVQIVAARRVNLRGGPSESAPILAVLDYGTPIFPQADDGKWMLVQVSGGPVGWVHGSLVGRPSAADRPPAAPHP